MQIGIGLPNQIRDVRGPVIPEWAVQAESAGFSALATIGRLAYPGITDTVALAAAAGATATIGLVSNVLLATTFPPAVLAKEAASIDAVSGGRLRLGLGVGSADIRPEDFVVAGLPPRGLGARLDHDLEVYRSVWRGEPVGGGPYPAVPAGTREVPLLFGGFAPAAFDRMGRWGDGYVCPPVPAMIAQLFETARAAWKNAGRDGSPWLSGIAYFVLGDADQGQANLRDYYQSSGPDVTETIIGGLSIGAQSVRAAVGMFTDLGADELIFNPALDSVNEVARLADVIF
jgi:alkanesulfonate monooxygenase SsuD/methylene tetrahydromethanopterin reductase-like flavin-dependent oxidoreductase (luciferase family)